MTPRSERGELIRLEVPLALLSAAVIGAAFVFASTGIPSWIPPAATTRAGVPSPLSGMTRSFVALASGHPLEAFRWHPLGPIVFGTCIAVVSVGVLSWRRGRRLEPLRRILAKRGLWWGVAAVFGAVWIRQVVWLAGFDEGLTRLLIR